MNQDKFAQLHLKHFSPFLTPIVYFQDPSISCFDKTSNVSLFVDYIVFYNQSEHPLIYLCDKVSIKQGFPILILVVICIDHNFNIIIHASSNLYKITN